MTEFSVSVDIQAPADRVLAVILDVEHWQEWTPSIASIQRMDSGPFRIGSEARVVQPKLRPAVWRVTELDERGFVWVTRGPGLFVAGNHHVASRRSDSTVTLSLQFSGVAGWLAARIYRKLNEQYLNMEANGLKARCETPVPPR